jgi:hypothetical protein
VGTGRIGDDEWGARRRPVVKHPRSSLCRLSLSCALRLSTSRKNKSEKRRAREQTNTSPYARRFFILAWEDHRSANQNANNASGAPSDHPENIVVISYYVGFRMAQMVFKFRSGKLSPLIQSDDISDLFIALN